MLVANSPSRLAADQHRGQALDDRIGTAAVTERGGRQAADQLGPFPLLRGEVLSELPGLCLFHSVLLAFIPLRRYTVQT